jgi:L,D-transpeptidase ErfK/SrfK
MKRILKKTTSRSFFIILLFFSLISSLVTVLDAQAAHYPIPNESDLIGALQTITIQPGDTFQKLGMKYGITPHQLRAANPQITDPRHLRIGDTFIIPSFFVLPKYRDGIVINLSELRLYYFDHTNQCVYTYPISAGRAGWRTPTAKTYVARKEENPTWHVPDSIREYMLETRGVELPPYIEPGPNNPLGHYGIYLGLRGYVIHGTNAPQQIGQYVSSGCIRMYNSDVEELYNMITIKTPVYIIHHPDKVGYKNGLLYLEVHEALYLNETPNQLNSTITEDVISEAEKDHIHIHSIDWHTVQLITEQKQGFPIIISDNERIGNRFFI